jgi:uncharacterized protein YaaR (DUF327 family)
MKILDAISARSIRKDAKTSASSNGSSPVRSVFSTELQQKENETNDYEREIEVLRKEIDAAGDKLDKEPTISNFSIFREILSKLAKRISSEAYRLEKCGGTPQNPRYYEIITTINIEADKLYKLIVQSQKNNMAITEKVIGIKGLVVDILT